MNDTTDAQAKELPPGIPEWVNFEALIEQTGGEADLHYRKDDGPRGRLLVDALARWAKSMLDVAQQPDLDEVIADRDVLDAINMALGFNDIDYVRVLVMEIYESMLKALDGEDRYDSWKDGYASDRDDIWSETRDVDRWISVGLGEPEGITVATEIVTTAGGVVTWPEGSPR